MSKELHILIGGTGTGKSTYAKQLSKEKGLKVFCPDNIEEKYLSLNANIKDDQIDILINHELYKHFNSSKSFILDGKCLRSKERIHIIKIAKSKGFAVYGYDFGSGNIVSLLRRLKNPRKLLSNYWKEVYESDKRLYEEPILEEGFERIYIPNNGKYSI